MLVLRITRTCQQSEISICRKPTGCPNWAENLHRDFLNMHNPNLQSSYLLSDQSRRTSFK